MTTTQLDTPAPGALNTLDANEIDQLPWRPVTGCRGVFAKELWRSGDSVHALIRLEAGSRTPGRPHVGAHHHIWVVSGEISIAGRPLAAGSYVYVPAGVAHPLDHVGTAGCTLLQMHQPHAPR
jgi:hypothetical protein